MGNEEQDPGRGEELRDNVFEFFFCTRVNNHGQKEGIATSQSNQLKFDPSFNYHISIPSSKLTAGTI